LIFSIRGHIDAIINGEKTQTRRPSNRYIVGRLYAIQKGRGCPAIPDGKIRIIDKKVETKPFDKIFYKDAKAEGGYSTEEYERLYEKMYPHWIERYVYEFHFIPTCQKSETD